MTRFSVIESVRHLIEQYRSFIKSSYRLADPALRAQFEEHVNRAEVLVKGPYVTLARDFAEGQRLDRVLASSCGHADLARFHWPFGSSPLYAHQYESERGLWLIDCHLFATLAAWLARCGSRFPPPSITS